MGHHMVFPFEVLESLGHFSQKNGRKTLFQEITEVSSSTYYQWGRPYFRIPAIPIPVHSPICLYGKLFKILSGAGDIIS